MGLVWHRHEGVAVDIRRCPDTAGAYRSPDTTDGDGHRARRVSLDVLG